MYSDIKASSFPAVTFILATLSLATLGVGCVKKELTACEIAESVVSRSKAEVLDYLRAAPPASWTCRGEPLLTTIATSENPHALELVREMLARGVDIDTTATNGATALHMAAGAADLALVELLIAHGARLDIQDARGNSPLHWLASMSSSQRRVTEDFEVVDALLKAGANLELRSLSGKTAADMARNVNNEALALRLTPAK